MSDIYSLCVQCGFNIPVDEDGCCLQCGADSLGPYADEAGKLKADLEAANKRIKELEQRQSFAAGNVGLSQIESLERENAILNRMVKAMAEKIKPKLIGWNPRRYNSEAGIGLEIYETKDDIINRYKKEATDKSRVQNEK